MPEFDQNPLDQLALQPGDIQDELDLGELGVDAALAQLAAFLAYDHEDATTRWAVRFARARGDGRLTLFQPIGHYLLDARRQGKIVRCLPLPDGTGYYVELPRSPSS